MLFLHGVRSTLIVKTSQQLLAAVDKLQSEIDLLTKPDNLGIRRFDAPGLINL